MNEERQEDPELLSLTLGMERHFGYREYKEMVYMRGLKPGEEIAIFGKLPKGGYIDFRYVVIDEGRVERGSLVEKTRKLLQGKIWFVPKRAAAT
jgi:hypothetical protein